MAARRIGLLSVAKVNALSKRGFYCDGGGLYLQVSQTGTKSWVFRFKENGKARDMGLGPLHTLSLKEARDIATEKRKLRLQGIDPIEARKQERDARRLEAAASKTFDECAEEYIRLNGDGWRNPKHRQQWTNTLATYVSPVMGSVSVRSIDTPLILKVLNPIWTEKPETAGRVRGRIETVLNYAKSCGYRTGDNPAQWTGHLANILPARSKIAKVRHHPALPWERAGEFMADLDTRPSTSQAALKFTILTAARTGESLKAQWSEIDLDKKLWTVPADRMKGGREHKVPLSAAALDLLGQRRKGLVFPSDAGKPLSDMALTMLLRGMAYQDKEGRQITTHGFRSTFRDWAYERSNFPREIVEAALAHVNGDKTEAAYKRGDALEKRRKLMDAWAAFCGQRATGNVVAIKRIVA